MKAVLRALGGALQFLTRLPLPLPQSWWPWDMPRVALAFPAVGLLIGLVLWLAAVLLGGTQAELVAALLLTLWVLITGNLHLDGLADSADAWAGGLGDRARSLEILRDPRCGPAALSLVLLTLILKYAALLVLLRVGEIAPAIWLAPLLARAGALWLLSNTEAAHQGSLLIPFRQGLSRRSRNGVLLMTGGLCLLVAGWHGLWILLAAFAMGAWLRRMSRQRLGGLTGDTLGAAIEWLELLVLLGFALAV